MHRRAGVTAPVQAMALVLEGRRHELRDRPRDRRAAQRRDHRVRPRETLHGIPEDQAGAPRAPDRGHERGRDVVPVGLLYVRRVDEDDDPILLAARGIAVGPDDP